jgi:hypothetical protein
MEEKMTNVAFGAGAAAGVALLTLMLAPLLEIAARVVA